MKKMYNEKLDLNDPLYNIKYTNIQSLRYMTDQTDNLKGKIYSKVYFSLSLIFTVLIAIFAQALNWLAVGFFINVLLFILVLFAFGFYKRRCENAKISLNIIKDLGRLGINIKI